MGHGGSLRGQAGIMQGHGGVEEFGGVTEGVMGGH